MVDQERTKGMRDSCQVRQQPLRRTCIVFLKETALVRVFEPAALLVSRACHACRLSVGLLAAVFATVAMH